MSAKDKEKEETPKKEEKLVSEEIETKDTKKSSKRKKPSAKKTKNVELSTLVELVESLEDKENIFLRLSINDYFNQYMEEMEYCRKGYEIAPYIRVDEFNKKMKK